MGESWREPWVLVVDDAEQTRRLIADELREAGCRVWTASNGRRSGWTSFSPIATCPE